MIGKEKSVKIDLDKGEFILPSGQRIKPPTPDVEFSKIRVFDKNIELAFEKAVKQTYQAVFGIPIENVNEEFKPKPAA